MKLLLADDHTLFRETLLEYLLRAEPDADIEVAEDFRQAYEILSGDPDFDLILLDLKMPGMNGLQGLRQIRQEFPRNKVALMSGVAESQDVADAIELGAIGYFPKTLSGKSLVEAIQKVLDGESFVPRDSSTGRFMPSYYVDDGFGDSSGTSSGVQPFLNGDSDSFSPPSGSVACDAADKVGLTPREREVLVRLAKGEANKEIANYFGLQVVTIKLHVRGICQKLKVKNRTQAALRAKELGLAD